MIDKKILHGLFCRHYSEMMHLARTLLYDDAEAEDTVQDVFVRLMQSDLLPAEDKITAIWKARIVGRSMIIFLIVVFCML